MTSFVQFSQIVKFFWYITFDIVSITAVLIAFCQKLTVEKFGYQVAHIPCTCLQAFG